MKATFLLLVENNAGYNGSFNWKQCNAGYWLKTMHGRYWAIAVLLCCRISGRLILTGQQLRFYLTMAPHSFAWTLGVVQTLYTETVTRTEGNRFRTFTKLLKGFDSILCQKSCCWHVLPNVFTKCFPKCFPNCFTKWFYQMAIWVPMWVISWS